MSSHKLDEKYKLEIPSQLNQLQRVEKFTEDVTTKMDFSEEDRDSIAISITEIVSNAISHGNKRNRDKKVTIMYEIYKNRLVITVQDEGTGFNVREIDDPLDPKNLLKDSGRGIYIVRALMDEVEFQTNEMGSFVKLVKNTGK
ncbi:ATP-binding protein [candidate division KSB1 bacterium]|nr:ATP-binding protein [candidate division KSB1 bacterium]